MHGFGQLIYAPPACFFSCLCLHCQFELALCAGMILAFDADGGRRSWLKYGLLFLSPLCGLASVALLPLFFARAAIDRCQERLLQSLVLAAGSGIQLALFFHVVATRTYAFDPAVLMSVVTVRHLAVPFLGTMLADPVAEAIRTGVAAGHVPLAAVLMPLLVFGPLAFAAVWRSRSRPAFWLLGAATSVAGAAYFGALGGAVTLVDALNGERYAVAPQALLGLSMLALAASYGGTVSRISGAAVAWLILAGAVGYTHPWQLISDGPAWRHEIALWRADPAHPIGIWPRGWWLTLEPQQVGHFR
jgi:hypothetical protein